MGDGEPLASKLAATDLKKPSSAVVEGPPLVRRDQRRTLHNGRGCKVIRIVGHLFPHLVSPGRYTQEEKQARRQEKGEKQMSGGKSAGRQCMRLHSGPAVPGHIVQQDEQQCTWVIDRYVVACTPPEYACLKLLLEQVDRGVSFAQLATVLPEHLSFADEKQTRMRLAHLMSKLRNKIWPLGLDIVSLRGQGYSLLSGSQGDTNERQSNAS